MINLFVPLLFLCVVVLGANSAKILAVFSFPSKSHSILANVLLRALAARGHQVTMMSPYPLKTTVENYEDIHLKGLAESKSDTFGQKVTDMQELSLIQRSIQTREMIRKMDNMFLSHDALKELLASNRTFDLVILNLFCNWASLGIADHFKAPVVMFSTFGSTILADKITGNTSPYSYVPNIFMSFPSEMTFLQRVGNTLGMLAFEYLEYLDTEMHERLLREHFPSAPPLEQLLQNVSLVLINSHFSIESPRPYLPNMIPIGGFHVNEPGELTGELKQYLDGATEGVLYFSFGSNIKAEALPRDKLNSIIKCFAKLPLKVLWKFEDDGVQNLPPNVRANKWFPQRDVLAHPNVRVFVSHGGLLSTTEAIYHGVPIVGIPFFADQRYNIADAVSKGYAVQVNFEDLSEETLTAALNEVLRSPKYRENIQMRSDALRDQPLKPLDNAVFWVEYVLRHKGAPILKSTALKLRWYQYFLVDVVAFLAGIFFTFVCVVYIILRTLLNIIKRSIYTQPAVSKPKEA